MISLAYQEVQAILLRMKADNFKSFFKAFKYAMSGIVHCIKNERNIRFHISAAVFVTILMRFYDLSGVEKAIVFLTIASVISAEMINTGVESVVDLVSPKYNRLAKIAKDACSGAVLIMALFSVVIAYNLFWDTLIFKEIIKFYSNNILHLIGLTLLAISALFFIFGKSNNIDRD